MPCKHEMRCVQLRVMTQRKRPVKIRFVNDLDPQ